MDSTVNIAKCHLIARYSRATTDFCCDIQGATLYFSYLLPCCFHASRLKYTCAERISAGHIAARSKRGRHTGELTCRTLTRKTLPEMCFTVGSGTSDCDSMRKVQHVLRVTCCVHMLSVMILFVSWKPARTHDCALPICQLKNVNSLHMSQNLPPDPAFAPQPNLCTKSVQIWSPAACQ